MLTIQTDSNQQLCYREISLLSKERNTPLLCPVIEKGKKNNLLIFDLTQYISIEELLQEQYLDKNTFKRITGFLLNANEWISKQHFNKDLVLGNISDIFIDVDTGRMKLVYVPIQPFDSSFDICAIISDIIRQATFEMSEDTTYMEKMIRMLNDSRLISAHDISAFLNEV